MTFEMMLREAHEDGMEEGLKEGMEEGMEEGMKVLVLYSLEDGKTQEQIELRLMRHFDVDAKMAHEIFCKYSHIASYDDIK